MTIYLGRSGQNLTIKPISNQDERAEKKKITDLKISKYPIYKADSFLYYETELANLSAIYQTWADNEIIVDLKAKEWIDQYKFNTISLKELPKSELTVLPLASWGYELKDYQLEFAQIDHRKVNLGLFLDTGSGKLAAMLLRALNLGCKRFLVFTTQGNFADWERDAHDIFGLDCVRFSNAQHKKSPIDLNSAPITLTNVEQAKFIKEVIADGMYDTIIIDEADDVSNPSSKNHKEIQLIKNKLKSRIATLACTATPVESSTDHERLWGFLSLVDKFAAGKMNDFVSKYREPTKFREATAKNGHKFLQATHFKTKNNDDLQRFLSTMVYRHDTSDSFKHKTFIDIIPTQWTEKQKDRYDEVLEEIRLLVKNNQPSLHKQQELFGVTEGIFDENGIHSGKFDVICKRIEKETKKTILWTAFVTPAKAYFEVFKDRAVIIYGAKSNNHKEFAKLAFQGAANDRERAKFFELRDKVKDYRFNEPGDCNLLIQTSSSKGGRGTNLNKAYYQIFSCINVSGKATKQSMGRNKRANTDHDIYYEFYAVDKTIDIRYIRKVFDKMKAMNTILTGEIGGFQMSGRDFLKLAKEKEELGIDRLWG